MHAVSIIVPTLNEAANIDLLLERIFAVESLREFDLEVVFSDGASTDKTCERVETWQQQTNKVHLVRSAANEGLSAAVMAGARAAAGEFVVVMDADLSHPPEVIPDLVRPLLSGDCDMVIGSRYVQGGDTPEWPVSRKISSLLATLPARLLTDVKDPLAGFIAVRRERLASMNREVRGFKIGLELLATGEEEMRVTEVPIIFRDRCYGTSKMSVRVVLDYCRQLLMFAGIDLIPGRFQDVFLICLASLITDTSLLTVFLESGIPPGWAHCLSFLPATVLGGILSYRHYLTHRQSVSGRRMTGYILGFFGVFLLTLFLRSGLVAAMTAADGTLSTANVFMTGVLGLAASYVGNIGYVFSIGQKRIRGSLVQRFYALGVAGFLVLLRLVYCGGAALLPEEQYYAGIVSESGSLTGLAGAPAPAVVGGFGQFLFDDAVFGFRVGGWLLWFVAATCVFNLARDMFDRSVAFRSFLLFSTLPFFFGTGLFVSGDAILALFWFGSLYVLYQALVGGVSAAWIWSGVVVGFGLQADPKLVSLLAGVAVYLLLSKNDRKVFCSKEPYTAVAALLLTFIPSLLIWGDGVAVRSYEGQDWLASILGTSLSNSYWAVLLFLSPTGVLAGAYVFIRWLRSGTEMQENAGWDNSKKRLFLITMYCLPLLIYLIPGLVTKGTVYAGSVVWAVLLPGMALTVSTEPLSSSPVAVLLNHLWWPTIGILTVTYGIGLHLAVL